MPELIYSVAINKINSIVRLWKSRNVTPIGKITIMKSLLLPQFNHLFMPIITPLKVLDTINKIFGVFWDEKPDKVKRNTIFQDYSKGDFKMVNIHNFENSMKLGWMKKIVYQQSNTTSPMV